MRKPPLQYGALLYFEKQNRHPVEASLDPSFPVLKHAVLYPTTKEASTVGTELTRPGLRQGSETQSCGVLALGAQSLVLSGRPGRKTGGSALNER